MCIRDSSMPVGLKPLSQTDAPVPTYSEDKYGFPCSGILNPRKAYCPALSGTSEANRAIYQLAIEPNPSTSQIRVKIPTDAKARQIRVFSLSGQQVRVQAINAASEIAIDLADLPAGEYLVVVGRYRGRVSRVGG